jgi:hypothetical protein
MSLVLTFAWVRTKVRGKPDQLNSLLPPYETVERGSKVGMIKKGPLNEMSPVLYPHTGDRG